VKTSKSEAWRSGQSKANLLANLVAMKGMTYAWGTTSQWSKAQQTDIESAFEKAFVSFNALPDNIKEALEDGTAQPSIEQALVDLRVLRTQVAERSEEHTSELQSRSDLVCRLLLEKKNNIE